MVLITNGEENTEPVGGKANNMFSNKLNKSVKTVADENTTQLADIANKIDTIYINALYPPAGCPAFKRNDTTFDNSPALQWLYNNFVSLKTLEVLFPEGAWEFKTTILNTNTAIRHLTIAGVKNASSGDNGTMLNYSGTGSFIELGTDSGNPWDTNEYNGVGFLAIKAAFITHSAPDTARSGGGGGTYKAGSYGIRDWRGGDIVLEDVTLQGFEYGFWGIQSDMNFFRRLHLRYNKVALFLGPRSDQFTCETLYAYSNDTVLKLDGVTGARFNNCQFVANGSPTTAPIDISSNLKASYQVVFQNCWFENFVLTGNLSFIDVGMTGSVVQDVVAIINPAINTTPTNTTSFMRLNKSKIVMLNNVGSITSGHFSSFIRYTGSTPDVTWVSLFNSFTTPTNFIDKTDATGSIRGVTWTNELGVPQIGSLNYNRWAFAGTQSDRYFEFNRPSADQLQITFDNHSSSNKTRLDLKRRVIHADAMPTTGEYQRGDMVFNAIPTELGTAGSKYIIQGWMRMINSSNHVLNTDWFEMRFLTGN